MSRAHTAGKSARRQLIVFRSPGLVEERKDFAGQFFGREFHFGNQAAGACADISCALRNWWAVRRPSERDEDGGSPAAAIPLR